MTYIQRVLQPGEVVKHRGYLHWMIYLRGLFKVLLGSGVILYRETLTHSVSYVNIELLLVLGFLILFWGLASLVRAWFVRWTTEIAVTDRRVIYKTGLIRRDTIEMNMEKVESVDVDQSVLGRILDYGTITIRGTGTGIEPLTGIDTPIELRNSVMVR